MYFFFRTHRHDQWALSDIELLPCSRFGPPLAWGSSSLSWICGVCGYTKKKNTKYHWNMTSDIVCRREPSLSWCVGTVLSVDCDPVRNPQWLRLPADAVLDLVNIGGNGRIVSSSEGVRERGSHILFPCLPSSAGFVRLSLVGAEPGKRRFCVVLLR